jgi:hypothetical protein
MTRRTDLRRTTVNTGDKCFACGRRLGARPAEADTYDDQWVYVGRECYKLIQSYGEAGYQPLSGGPKLYILTEARRSHYRTRGMYP